MGGGTGWSHVRVLLRRRVAALPRPMRDLRSRSPAARIHWVLTPPISSPCSTRHAREIYRPQALPKQRAAYVYWADKGHRYGQCCSSNTRWISPLGLRRAALGAKRRGYPRCCCGRSPTTRGATCPAGCCGRMTGARTRARPPSPFPGWSRRGTSGPGPRTARTRAS